MRRGLPVPDQMDMPRGTHPPSKRNVRAEWECTSDMSSISHPFSATPNAFHSLFAPPLSCFNTKQGLPCDSDQKTEEDGAFS